MATQIGDKLFVSGGYLDGNQSVVNISELNSKLSFLGQSLYMPTAFTSTKGWPYPIDFWSVPNGDGIKWEIKTLPNIESEEDFEVFKVFCNEFYNELGNYPIPNGSTVLVNGEVFVLMVTEDGIEWISLQQNIDATISDAVNLAVEEAVDAITSGATEAFDTLKEVEEWINVYSAETKNEIEKVLNSAKTYTDDKVSVVNDRLSSIIANDEGKTIRTIAAEEISAQLISEDASESLDTLEEIAAWIQSHPEDAAAMNAKILALEASAHMHTNKSVLDGITTEKINAWDSAEKNAKEYTNESISALEEDLMWLPIEGGEEKHKVRFWRGKREKYELLVKKNAVNDWTRYTVIDTINGTNFYTEYFGQNQIADLTGQLLPVKSVIANINDLSEFTLYDRYLVGADGDGYFVYEYVIDSEKKHKWIIKSFDYRYGIRVIDRGLKNYVYVNGVLKTYDDVDCGEF